MARLASERIMAFTIRILAGLSFEAIDVDCNFTFGLANTLIVGILGSPMNTIVKSACVDIENWLLYRMVVDTFISYRSWQDYSYGSLSYCVSSKKHVKYSVNGKGDEVMRWLGISR